jgi:SAM-dependent methyltransferase
VKREDWNRRYAEIDSLWSLTPNRLLVAEVTDLRQGKALDLACGEGRNAIWLAERGWRVTAVDYAEIAIEKAHRRAAEEHVEVDFRVQDLLAFEPEQRAYDLVVVLYLQIPAVERRQVLAMAAEAVAPAGTLLFVGHDLLNATEGVGGPSDPSVLYTPDDIVAELPGLDIEKAERVLRDVEDADRPAIDALVRAIRP